MLYLSELTLSHFRSHKISQLQLDGRPVAIYGTNGSGKTNILEAVSLFSPGRGMRRASASDMTRRPEELGWKLSGTLNRGHRSFSIDIKSENGSARRVHLDEQPAPQTALAELSQVIWLVPNMDRLWTEGADNRRRFLDRMALSFDPRHAEASLNYEKAMRERNRLLKDNVRDPHWYRALERQMAESGCQIHSARVHTLELVIAAQNTANTAFPVAELSLDQSQGEMPETPADFIDALENGRGRDLAAGRTLIGPHRTDLLARYATKDIDARDCSTGEQKALLVSMILANARALAQRTQTPPMILLDEVSAHLDAGRRADLYDEICTLGAQAWLTGTEPDLFAELGQRAQYIAVTDNAGVSAVRQHEAVIT